MYLTVPHTYVHLLYVIAFGVCSVNSNNNMNNLMVEHQHLFTGKVQAVIELRLYPSQVRKVGNGCDRNIFLFPGDLQITSDMNVRGYLID